MPVTVQNKTSPCQRGEAKRQKAEGQRQTERDRLREEVGGAAHLRLMTKALMRMMSRTMLPTTDTSSTVELVPSPMMGAGTA